MSSWTYGLLISLSMLSAGCNEVAISNPSAEGQVFSSERKDSARIPTEKVAICVYPQAGLRLEAGKKKLASNKRNNYIATVYYGESVEMLGDSVEVESENRSYMKVRLQDGQEGWVHDYLFEKQASLAAMISGAEIYRRPDLMTLRDDKFEVADIIVSMEQQGKWLHVTGRKKEKKGWILLEKNMISWERRDVKVALKYYLALHDEDEESKNQKLQAILKDKDLKGSVLLKLVRTRLEEATSPGPNRLNTSAAGSSAIVVMSDTMRRR